MKIRLLKFTKPALSLCLLAATVSSLFAQGSMSFGNALGSSTTGLRAPVYGPDPNNPAESRQGNAGDGLPAGTQTYGGALLAGTGYTAALYTLAGSNYFKILETVFRTGTASGYVVPEPNARDPNHPPGATVTAVVRVWENQGGTISDWNQALASPSTLLGESAPFTVVRLGGLDSDGNIWFSPQTLNLRSFNIYARAGAFILAQPQDLIVAPGAMAQFHVDVASSVGPPSFQWQRDGADIPGANRSTLGLTNVQYTDAGGYSLLVSVPSATLTSRVARLCVPPRIADISYNFVPEWGAVAFRISYDSMPQRPVRVEVRSTLRDTWINMGQFISPAVRGYFFDIGPTNDQRFYQLSVDP